MAPTTNAWRNADRLAKGRLAEILSEHRAAGESPETIARLIYKDHGISVSTSTLIRWLNDLASVA